MSSRWREQHWCVIGEHSNGTLGGGGGVGMGGVKQNSLTKDPNMMEGTNLVKLVLE